MTPSQADDSNQPDIEADRQADAMKDQLRKDVASWSASRSGETIDPGAKSPAQARQAGSPPAVRATRQKAKPVEVPKPVVVEKKPFKMSYDGTTDRDYIAHRIKYGAR
jgi:hypothetical protein